MKKIFTFFLAFIIFAFSAVTVFAEETGGGGGSFGVNWQDFDSLQQNSIMTREWFQSNYSSIYNNNNLANKKLTILTLASDGYNKDGVYQFSRYFTYFLWSENGVSVSAVTNADDSFTFTGVNFYNIMASHNFTSVGYSLNVISYPSIYSGSSTGAYDFRKAYIKSEVPVICDGETVSALPLTQDSVKCTITEDTENFIFTFDNQSDCYARIAFFDSKASVLQANGGNGSPIFCYCKIGEYGREVVKSVTYQMLSDIYDNKTTDITQSKTKADLLEAWYGGLIIDTNIPARYRSYKEYCEEKGKSVLSYIAYAQFEKDACDWYWSEIAYIAKHINKNVYDFATPMVCVVYDNFYDSGIKLDIGHSVITIPKTYIVNVRGADYCAQVMTGTSNEMFMYQIAYYDFKGYGNNLSNAPFGDGISDKYKYSPVDIDTGKIIGNNILDDSFNPDNDMRFDMYINDDFSISNFKDTIKGVTSNIGDFVGIMKNLFTFIPTIIWALIITIITLAIGLRVLGR